MAADAERYRALLESTLADLGVAFDLGGLETQPTPSIQRLFDDAAHEPPTTVAMWAVHAFYWRKGIANRSTALPATSVIRTLASKTTPLEFIDALIMGARRGYYDDTDASHRYVTSLLTFLNENNWYVISAAFDDSDNQPWKQDMRRDDVAKMIINVTKNTNDHVDFDAAVLFTCLFELHNVTASMAHITISLPVALHALVRFIEQSKGNVNAVLDPSSTLPAARFIAHYLVIITPDRGIEYDSTARIVDVICNIIQVIPDDQRSLIVNSMSSIRGSLPEPSTEESKALVDDYLMQFEQAVLHSSERIVGGGINNGRSPPIVALVSRLQAELVKCRMNAVASNDTFTYRRTKVSVLTHVRRSIEQALRFKGRSTTDQGKSIIDICVQLHNSPRHLFTLTTWKEVFPAIENFIRSDDPTKQAKHSLIQARMQLYALIELARMLDTAKTISMSLMATLQEASTDATKSSSSLSTCFKSLDSLIWLQQKTWREHAFDDFYTQSDMQKYGYDTIAWCIQNINLFIGVNNIENYSPFLSRLLQERTTAYDDAVEAAIVNADVNFPYNGNALDVANAAADLFNPCMSTNSGRISMQSKGDDTGNDGNDGNDDNDDNDDNDRIRKPQGPKDIIDSLFDDIIGNSSEQADDVFISSFLDEMDQYNSAPTIQRGGKYRGGYTDKEIFAKMPVMQRKVSILVDDVKKFLMECTSTIDMIKMTLTSRDQATQWNRLQYCLQRVGDVFYHRIRLGPNHYFRPFGADSKLAAGKNYLENPFDKSGNSSIASRTTLELLISSLTEIDAVLIFVLKFSRVATLLLSIYVAQHVFLERYIHDVYTAEKPPPSLFNILLFALSIDACLQLIVITLIVIASVMLKTPKNSFVLDDVFLTMLLKEYVLSTILMIILGSIIAWIMGKKRYFGYRTDGIRVVKAYNAVLLGVLIAVAIIPCFKLFI